MKLFLLGIIHKTCLLLLLLRNLFLDIILVLCNLIRRKILVIFGDEIQLKIFLNLEEGSEELHYIRCGHYLMEIKFDKLISHSLQNYIC